MRYFGNYLCKNEKDFQDYKKNIVGRTGYVSDPDSYPCIIAYYQYEDHNATDHTDSLMFYPSDFKEDQ
jgi:hypothetical protein